MTVHKLMCKCCGQPLPPRLRGGVYLNAKQAEIFDFIDAHPGVTAEGIAYHCYGDDSMARRKLVAVHINHINSMLASTNIVIVGQAKYKFYVGGGKNRFCKGEYRVLRNGSDGYAAKR